MVYFLEASFNFSAAIENNKLEKSFSIASLSEGVYFLIIESGKSRTVKKIIKNN